MSQQQGFQPANLALCTFAIALGVFMQVLDSTIANVSLPTIAGNMGVSLNQGTWVITSFTVSNAIGLPVTAWLSRRIGEVHLYVGALIFFLITSFLCGIAQSMNELVIYRTLQGFAAAPLFPMSQVLLMSIFPAAKRSMALALLGMVAVVGPIVGPILGGWLTYDYSWPWIFFINIPIGIFAVMVVLSQLKDRPHKPVKAPLDYIGFTALVLGVGALQVVLDKGNDLDWFSDPWIIGGSVFAAIMLVFLVIWELTDDHPIINLRLFANRNFRLGTIILTLGYAGFFSINLILPQWLQSQMGYTSVWAGLAAAPMGMIPLFLTPILGRLGPRLDMRKLAASSFVVISLSCFMRSNFTTDVDFYTIASIQLFMGIGISLFFMPMTTILLSDLNGPAIADAASLSTFIRTLGASFASSVTTWFWTHNASLHHSVLTEHINPYNPLAASFSGENSTSALMSINNTIDHQSYMLSTLDLFNILMWMFVVLIPFVFLTVRPRPAPAHGGAAH
ncbi:DHA2 family efflux MFS transporter permease subunit [Tolumonas osonensis]|uniref:DHA2 family multidrug resistance protein n=1 Tax=Tolumonas osonensis TaxID=675874 RepID=A0A841GK45_9GAMM|nr:DHA2 family efflux MFS transporter permease subunit [Tolumonas osonensis]MBB6054872.1 DHA2 family multidrug resistance protein [Tolumonas osonensis]